MSDALPFVLVGLALLALGVGAVAVAIRRKADREREAADPPARDGGRVTGE